jgi:hypothetical protein
MAQKASGLGSEADATNTTLDSWSLPGNAICLFSYGNVRALSMARFGQALWGRILHQRLYRDRVGIVSPALSPSRFPAGKP